MRDSTDPDIGDNDVAMKDSDPSPGTTTTGVADGSGGEQTVDQRGKDRNATPEDRVVEWICQHMMESICIDVASNMHMLIKTGADDVIPSSWNLFSGTKVPTRRELYPELYNGVAEVTTEEDETAEVEATPRTSDAKSGDDDCCKDAKNEKGETDTKPSSSERLPAAAAAARSASKKRMTDEEIRAELEKYSVDLPSESYLFAGNNRKRRSARDVAEEEEKQLLLSKLQKEKESGYKDSDDEEDAETEDATGDDEDEDEDDEDFKMEDAEDNDDDDDDDDHLGDAEIDDNPDKDGKTKKDRSLSTTTTSSAGTAPDGPVSSAVAKEGGCKTPSAGVTDKLDIWGKMPPKEPKNRLCRCRICGRLISTSRFASHLDKCMGLSTIRGGGGPGNSGLSVVSGGPKPMTSSSMGGATTKKIKRGIK